MTEPLIDIEELTKIYPGGRHAALRGVSLRIPGGAVFGLLGPNGAGKTTLISILAGVADKTGGRVRVDGSDHDRDRARIRGMIGLVPQEYAFYPTLTARQNLEFFAGVLALDAARRRERIDECVRITDLAAHLDKRAGRFSGGLKRRLNLAIGLLNQPKILILDEPTVGIDPQSRHFILQSLRALRAQGVTIIYTSHYMDEVEQICDRIAIIDDGRIVAEGDKAALLGQGGEQRLVAVLDPAPGTEGRRAVAEALGSEVTFADDGSLEAVGSVEVVERLTGLARARGWQVRSLHYGRRGLEDVFLELTKTGLRD